MSSTNRGAVRNEADFYATPEWCVDAILPLLALGGPILEPAVGEGVIVRRLLAHDMMASVTMVDIEDRLAGVPPDRFHLYDFLAWSKMNPGRFGTVITNPPYSLAMEFVQAALDVTEPGGEVVMLLRLNFLGSQKRATWLRENPPDVYVLPKRPSFTNGGTDSCEYAWFRWVKASRAEFGRVCVLPLPGVPR